jgi:hypothetical protein
MPTVEAGSRQENIARSVDAYIRTHIEVGLSTTVYYENQYVPTSVIRPSYWIEPTLNYLGQVSQLSRKGSGFQAWVNYALDFNIIEQTDAIGVAQVNRYALRRLATDVSEVFEVGVVVPIFDYDTVGSPWAGGLSVNEKPQIVAAQTPDDQVVRQIDVRVTLEMIAVTV